MTAGNWTLAAVRSWHALFATLPWPRDRNYSGRVTNGTLPIRLRRLGGLDHPRSRAQPLQPTLEHKTTPPASIHPSLPLFPSCGASALFSVLPVHHNFGFFSDDIRASAEAQSELIADGSLFLKLLGALLLREHLLPCESWQWIREDREGWPYMFCWSGIFHLLAISPI